MSGDEGYGILRTLKGQVERGNRLYRGFPV